MPRGGNHSHALPDGWLLGMLADGRLAAAAVGAQAWADVARRIGVTPKALTCARKRAGARVPSLEELQGAPRFANSESVPSTSTAIPNMGTPPANENRWPNLLEFEAATFRDESAVYRAPYVSPAAQSFRKWTQADAPDGTLAMWISDVHIPIQDDPALRLAVECAERMGVTRVVAGGDILDMNCLSKHAKESRRTVEHATVLEEVEPGRWFLDWLATKQTDFIIGNHEDRLKRFIDENPAFHGSVASNFGAVVQLPSGINVLPQGGEVRLGNLSARHLDAEFKRSTGGKYPAQRLLDMLPDQSTIGGHLHRISQARRTTRDEDGIRRTRCAWVMGHMSIEEMHYGYVSTAPNWQTGFGLIRVFWEDGRPRWSVYPVEVLFDRYNRPYFEFGGHVYR